MDWIIKTHRWSKTLPPTVRYIKKRMFRNFDPDIFRQEVSNMPEQQQILEVDDVETAASLLTSGLTRILDRLAPLKRIQIKKQYAPYISEQTKQLQKRRAEAQARSVETGQPEDFREFKSLRNQTLTSLRNDETQWQKHQLNGSSNSPSDLWRSVKGILGWSSSGPPSQLLVDGKHITSPLAMATTLNKFYIDKQKKIIDEIPKVDADPLGKLRERMEGRECNFTIQMVTEEEVLSILNSLKNTTSTGVDWIDNRCLKLAAKELTTPITRIINLSINSSTFPTSYKTSKIIPLLKKSSNPILCNSFRPVNQLGAVSKVLERAIFSQLVSYLENNNLLHPNQHGGRKGHSTTTALIQMYDQWCDDLEDGKTIGIQMLDQSAYFDICDHQILKDKMRLLGLTDSALNWMSSYLSSRSQLCIVDGFESSILHLPEVSVVQGGIGSGILATIMTIDLPDIIHDHPVSLNDQAKHCETDGDMVTFVDDSTSYFGHQDPVVVAQVNQSNFKKVENYMHSQKLKINSSKTHMIVMTKENGEAQDKRDIVTLEAGGKTITGSQTELLLGCLIDQTGNFKTMIRDGKQSVVNQMKTRVAATKKVSKNESYETRLMVATGLVQSKLSYLLPLYGAAPDYLLRCLQVQQLAAARVVLGYGSYWWSTTRILDAVGWLSVKQMHAQSVILLAHKVICTGVPRAIKSGLNTAFQHNTRRAKQGQIRFGENIRGRGRTALTNRTFRYQASILYNQIPPQLRTLKPDGLKKPLKKWIKQNIPIR